MSTSSRPPPHPRKQSDLTIPIPKECLAPISSADLEAPPTMVPCPQCENCAGCDGKHFIPCTACPHEHYVDCHECSACGYCGGAHIVRSERAAAWSPDR